MEEEQVSIEQLLEQLEKVRGAPEVPTWVSVLLQAVVVLIKGLARQIQDLVEDNARLRKELYGRKSEKRKGKGSEKKKTGKKGTREPKERKPRTGPSALDQTEMPEEHQSHELADEDQVCEYCGGTDFVELPSTEDSVEYKYVPAHLIRVFHHRKKWACANGCTVVTAPGPSRVIDGGRFHASLYAHVVTSRLLDAMPFNRQADMLSRAGTPLSASTISDLFHNSAEVLKPLYQELGNHPIEPALKEEG